MEMIKDFEKALEMGKRIYNSKTIEKLDAEGRVTYSDEEAIKSLCSRVFSKEGEINSIEDLRSFNKLIVEVANVEAQAKFEKIINAVSDFKSVDRFAQIQYHTVPLKTQTTAFLSAVASGVDFTKIPSRQTKVPAIPQQRQLGVQYSINEMVNEPVNAFRSAVDRIVEAKLSFIFKEIMKLARGGKDAGKIPASQYSNVSNLTITAFRKIEDKLIRAGRNARPVLIADNSFIGALALKQGTEGLGGTGLSWLTDEMRESFLRNIEFDMVSRSVAIPTDNPFVTDANDSVDLDPSEALLLAGSNGSGSPFQIVEYGGLRMAQDMPSIEKEQVLMKLSYDISIVLLLGNKLAYIVDDAIIL